MIVYKFGGASVKDANGIRNLSEIVSKETENLVIVVSAFGKTTNALERLLKAWYAGETSYRTELSEIRTYHFTVADELLGDESEGKKRLAASFDSLSDKLNIAARGEYDHDYDMIVSMGEIWSTMVVEAYLRERGRESRWIDIRKLLLTDDRYRDANILWPESTTRIRETFSFKDNGIYVTQGFIGCTSEGETTTLGREGSDYTAAILGNILDAERVVVWKDVPGIMSADPKWIEGAETIRDLSYNEAVEMTFSGAKVIHPKTIKPLHNKNIPMHVRSFIDHDEKGTVISSAVAEGRRVPVFIKKENQILVSILPKDLSFVMGENLAGVFHYFEQCGVKVNMVQAGAVSIDVCADDERPRIETVKRELGKEYKILYNEGVEMLTIRHYQPGSENLITRDAEILISQRTRTSARFVVRRK
ncbi:MAG TPA: aspartate kinase [Bacteroidales bacterium]|nr:aspartate kinase [Bacteroidales bacterium]HPT12343.1 aspartate kinase [Bacteroidales bacterium]